MKLGLKPLIVGIVVFVFGAFVLPFVFLVPLFTQDSDEQLFLVPGSSEVVVEEPGRYYLWNHHRVIFEGNSYNKPEGIPDGLEISVVDAKGGKLEFIPSGSTSMSDRQSAKRSVGYVEAEHSGTLTVKVSGDAEPHVFSLSQSGLLRLFGLIFGAFGASILMALIAIGLMIWGIVKLINPPKNKTTPPPVPA